MRSTFFLFVLVALAGLAYLTTEPRRPGGFVHGQIIRTERLGFPSMRGSRSLHATEAYVQLGNGAEVVVLIPDENPTYDTVTLREITEGTLWPRKTYAFDRYDRK